MTTKRRLSKDHKGNNGHRLWFSEETRSQIQNGEKPALRQMKGNEGRRSKKFYICAKELNSCIVYINEECSCNVANADGLKRKSSFTLSVTEQRCCSARGEVAVEGRSTCHAEVHKFVNPYEDLHRRTA